LAKARRGALGDRRTRFRKEPWAPLVPGEAEVSQHQPKKRWFARLTLPTAPVLHWVFKVRWEGGERDLTDPQPTLARRARMMVTAAPHGQAR